MRIAFVVSGFPRLSQTFIDSQIVSLLARDVDVRIFATEPEPGELEHPLVAEHGLRERTTYQGRPPASLLKRQRAALVLAAGRPRAQGLRVLRTLNPLRFQAMGLLGTAALRFSEDFVADSFDAVHCHFGTVCRPMAALKAVGLVKPPLLTTFYGYDASSFLDERGPAAYRHVFGQSDRVLVLSEAMRQRLLNAGCPASKLRVHHLGVDTSRFRLAEAPEAGGGPLKLLTVCRLAPKKAIADAIEALAIAADRGLVPRGWVFTVAGDGPLREELKTLVAERGLEESVRFLGAVSSPRVRELMDEHHAFLSPSKTAADGDQEGTPTAIIEASASGLPVLSTRHAGIPEVVIDGKTGWLVSEGDVSGLAEAIGKLEADRARGRQMGLAGREHVLANFDQDSLAERLVEHYREAAALS